jgi:hypothetical protein
MALPDQEVHMDEVQRLAEQAREEALNGPIPAAPPHVATATPIYLGKAHEVIPHSYMLHYKVQHCKGCGTDVMVSQFYALSFIRSRMTGQRVTHLIPCDTPLYNLPIETKLVGRNELPVCHACVGVSADLSHLPLPPQESQLYDLDEPRNKGEKPKAKAKSEAKPRGATLDDLA